MVTMTRPVIDHRTASDVNLVIAVGRYDQAALTEVYERHGGAVFGLALRLLRDRSLAEDVVQTVFIRFWDHPDRFDAGRGTLRSFLLAQTHGRSVDLIRAESARHRREERAGQQDRRGENYDLEREVVDLTAAEHVKEILATLPDGEREAIELAYFEGHTYKEVAVVLDQPEGTVKSRIRSGLRRMHTELIKAGTEAPS
jgi:RNA polymerase sigma-70 factor (ECF subfamily)